MLQTLYYFDEENLNVLQVKATSTNNEGVYKLDIEGFDHEHAVVLADHLGITLFKTPKEAFAHLQKEIDRRIFNLKIELKVLKEKRNFVKRVLFK